MKILNSIIGTMKNLPTAEDVLRIYLSLVIIFMAGSANAAIPTPTSWNVNSNPQMFLEKSISPSQTLGITIAAPKRNGDTITYPTTSGGILRLRRGSTVEDIYYSTGSVNATTKVVTLFGVLRDIDPDNDTAFVSLSGGRQFGRGTITELSNHHLLSNLKTNIDRVNIMKGSGAFRSNQTSQPFLFINGHTTAEIAAFTNNGESGDHYIDYDSDQGCFVGFDGSSALCFANTTGAIVNASETVRGVIQLSTTALTLSGSTNGSTGAPLVVPNDQFTMSGGTAGQVPILNTDGVLAVRVGGTGIRSLTQSGILIGNSGSSVTFLVPNTEDFVIKVDSTGNFTVGVVPTKFDIIGAITGSSAIVGASDTGENEMIPTFTGTGVLAADSLAVGDVIHIRVSGKYRLDTSNLNFRVKIGGTTLFENSGGTPIDSSLQSFDIDSYFTVIAIGASGRLVPSGSLTAAQDGAGGSLSTITEIDADTTTALAITFTAQFSGSDAQHEAYVETGQITHTKQ